MRLLVPSTLRAFTVGPFRSQASLGLAHPALRHPWAVAQQATHRPRLRWPDRPFWGWLSRRWSGWHATLVLGGSEPRDHTCHRTSLGLVIARRYAIGNGNVCLMVLDMSTGHLLCQTWSSI